MKVLYAIQGTGNGHLSRAMDIIPILKKYCEVDILVSGSQNDIKLPWPVKYTCRGFTFYYRRQGGIDYARSGWNNFSRSMIREIRQLPVHLYDLVINDFEPVSAWAAHFRRVPCVAFGHQASFLSSNVPRPAKKDLFGEFVLKHYAPAKKAVGLHFLRYDEFIHSPIIRKKIRALEPKDKGHYTVYLPSVRDGVLVEMLLRLPLAKWEVFSPYSWNAYKIANVQVRPVDSASFTESITNCTGVLTGAGFETPAEALYLGKKLFVIPIKGHYEQQCNAAALKDLNVPVGKKMDKNILQPLRRWILTESQLQIDFPDHTEEIVSSLLKRYAMHEVIEPLTSDRLTPAYNFFGQPE